jgi:SAM-dependent methyltransferase
MKNIPWYKTFFGEDYLEIYKTILPPERTAREVEGIINLLALPPGSSILDLCCGHGRHSIPLAQRGYQMTGQDLSEVFLQHARTEAEAQGVQVRWIHSDMRDIPFENEFDAVINIFTAFGYFENEEEDQKVLSQVHKALKPGGLFLIEVIHHEGLMRHHLAQGIDRHPDGLIVLEERCFDLLTSRSEVLVTMLYPDGRRSEYNHSLRVYTLAELAHMLDAAGLQVQAYYGGLNGSQLTLDSFRLAVISRKEG